MALVLAAFGAVSFSGGAFLGAAGFGASAFGAAEPNWVVGSALIFAGVLVGVFAGALGLGEALPDGFFAAGAPSFCGAVFLGFVDADLLEGLFAGGWS